MATYRPKDRFYHRAREQGLPSRAAFKLQELLARFRLLAPDSRVLDLGCAPGGWLAIMAAAAPSATIVGIDVVACRPPCANVKLIVGDACRAEMRKEIVGALDGPADLVTSDMAPKLTGIRARDQAGALVLLEAAEQIATEVLKPGGALVIKVFMNDELRNVVERLRRGFRHVDLVHTAATRPGSRELYLVARGYRRAAA